MGKYKLRIKLKLRNKANNTYITPKENKQSEASAAQTNRKLESTDNLKKIEENAVKTNHTERTEEMGQTDIVEQKKLSKYLETISKLLGILTISGTIAGGWLIYNYLENIGQLSIFSDVITNLSVLIATTIIFVVILLFFYCHFLLSFSFGIKFRYIKKVKKWYIYILGIILIFIYLDYYFLSKYIKELILSIVLMLLIYCICFIYFLLGHDKYFQKDRKQLYFLFLYSTYFIIFYLSLNSFFLFESIHFVRFAETPKNSSWYLLHNNFQQNNGFQETNGINKSDLKELKNHFYKSNLCTEKELKEHTLQYYSTQASRENALYGYMAWNLGDTKVFCPSYVNNKFSNINNQITDYCIVISGKALQIMPERYISTEPI